MFFRRLKMALLSQRSVKSGPYGDATGLLQDGLLHRWWCGVVQCSRVWEGEAYVTGNGGVRGWETKEREMEVLGARIEPLLFCETCTYRSEW